jgi:hypothetical protein
VAIALGIDLRIHVLDHSARGECFKGSVMEFYLILPGVQYRILVFLTERFTVVSASSFDDMGGPRAPIQCFAFKYSLGSSGVASPNSKRSIVLVSVSSA